MTAVIFWTALLLVLYVYFGYPLLIACFAKLARRRSAEIATGDFCPRISILITAYNEERWIARKIENTLELDYPAGKLEIVVASDGSSDATEEIARTYSSRGVRVISFGFRHGKQELLNRVIPTLEPEIVILTDATALLERSAAGQLARHFADPDVGCVAGRRVCVVQKKSAASAGESAYWRYESWIKQNETSVHSCTCADGQIYAVRRTRVPQAHQGGEDFFIPMSMVASGLRFVFEPAARALVPAAGSLRSEFRRKVRSHVSFLLNAWLLRRLFVPFRCSIWWQLTSHHLLRMAVPAAMAALFVSSALLTPSSHSFRVALLAQCLFYLLAAAGYWLAHLGIRLRIFFFPFYFTFAQIALAVAWFQWATGYREFAWQRTERFVDAN